MDGGLMDGWMHKTWMEGWTNGWMDTDGWKAGLMDGWMHKTNSKVLPPLEGNNQDIK